MSSHGRGDTRAPRGDGIRSRRCEGWPRHPRAGATRVRVRARG